MPLCPLGRSTVAGSRSRSPPPDAATPAGDDEDVATGSGWDGRYLVQTGFDIPLVGAERRHSGWEAVEKRWGPRPPRRDSEKEGTSHVGLESAGGRRLAAESEFSRATIVDGGGGGLLQAHPLALPLPRLEPAFRLRLVLSPADATSPQARPGRQWNSVTGGAWAGKLGRGLVTGGGQETLRVPIGNGAPAAQVEARFQLRTAEEPPAVIECRAKGAVTEPSAAAFGYAVAPGPHTAAAAETALSPCAYRVVLTMGTADARYAETVNAGLWVATCLWLGNEAIYDAYRIV